VTRRQEVEQAAMTVGRGGEKSILLGWCGSIILSVVVC
jgi:hypothetical protein